MSCKVIPVSEYVNDMNMKPFGRLSDHSLLFLDVLSMDYDTFHLSESIDSVERGARTRTVRHVSNSPQEKLNTNSIKQIKYKIKDIPEDFMLSEEVLDKSRDLIDSLLEMRMSQDGVNRWYDKFQNLLHEEMNKHFK